MEGKDMGTGDIIFLTIVAILVVAVVLSFLTPRSKGGQSQPGDNQSSADFFDGGDGGGD
jgi:hypothetical protein